MLSSPSLSPPFSLFLSFENSHIGHEENDGRMFPLKSTGIFQKVPRKWNKKRQVYFGSRRLEICAYGKSSKMFTGNGLL